jgi:hypothetical protein
MKNVLFILLSVLLLQACSKQKPSTIYVGTWTSVESNGWSHTTRILTIPSKGKGHYSKKGIFSNSIKGKVRIDGDKLFIRSKEFTIDQPPTPIENGLFHMILNGFNFYRT